MNILNFKYIENPKYMEKQKWNVPMMTKNLKSNKDVSLGGRIHGNDKKRYKYIKTAACLVTRLY